MHSTKVHTYIIVPRLNVNTLPYRAEACPGLYDIASNGAAEFENTSYRPNSNNSYFLVERVFGKTPEYTLGLYDIASNGAAEFENTSYRPNSNNSYFLVERVFGKTPEYTLYM